MNTPATPARRHRSGLLGAMDREWPQLIASGAARRARRRWRPLLAEDGLDGLGLEELAGIIRHPGDQIRSDVVARVLIAAAQDGDELAARTLMQGLIPFVGRLAGTYARYGAEDLDDVVAEVLAAVQLRIMRTDLDAHRQLLVTYLQLTVRRQLARLDGRRVLRARPEIVDGDLVTDHGDSDPHAHAGTALSTGASCGRRTAVDHVTTIVTAGVRRGFLSRDDAQLLLLIAAGNSAAAIARTLQRDKSVISRRLQRATLAAGQVAA